ncbi:hypothetical protein [Foetidibacter luteolus]|uniref:hypothetical protein n=1 Tax=Foetidibacter luteolus TaxID=2608880 RepID=UPI00129B6316|nr:hypothetical protein [Foetidibacter luteolus]
MVDDLWKHVKTIPDGEYFEISGLNIWNCKWESTGESVEVKDPLYGQTHRFTIYEIQNERRRIQFAAGEFSNCVWGIYQKECK